MRCRGDCARACGSAGRGRGRRAGPASRRHSSNGLPPRPRRRRPAPRAARTSRGASTRCRRRPRRPPPRTRLDRSTGLLSCGCESAGTKRVTAQGLVVVVEAWTASICAIAVAGTGFPGVDGVPARSAYAVGKGRAAAIRSARHTGRRGVVHAGRRVVGSVCTGAGGLGRGVRRPRGRARSARSASSRRAGFRARPAGSGPSCASRGARWSGRARRGPSRSRRASGAPARA